jgi:hypothetical protein
VSLSFSPSSEFIQELPPTLLGPDPPLDNLHRLGSPLADLCRSHPLTILHVITTGNRFFAKCILSSTRQNSCLSVDFFLVLFVEGGSRQTPLLFGICRVPMTHGTFTIPLCLELFGICRVPLTHGTFTISRGGSKGRFLRASSRFDKFYLANLVFWQLLKIYAK